MYNMLVLLFAIAVYGVPIPEFMVLSAPWTPFHPDGSLDLSPIGALAANFAAMGVNTVWVGGGMGQFDVLSVNERNALTEAWAIEGHKHNLFIIAHVGTTNQRAAIEMATFAVTAGVDAIASVPPYYEHAPSIQGLVDWFVPITAAAPKLPFYYYHIPGSTGQPLNIFAFTSYIQTSGKLPTFAGVKFVDGDQGTFFECVNDPVLVTKYNYMWAPEPKLQSFTFPGNGTILAESFYAGTFLRMWDHFNRGDLKAARAEQAWKSSVETIFGAHGGTNAKRAVYLTLAGVDIGINRLPTPQTPVSSYQSLVAQLKDVGFFNQSFPKWTPPRA